MKPVLLLACVTALTATAAHAAIPHGATIYSCHLIQTDGGYTSLPTWGFNEKEAVMRSTLDNLMLEGSGYVVKKSRPTDIITDVKCVPANLE